MKQEVAKLWVEALRSDKYKQTTKKLRRNNAYCCLGVLCEVAMQAGVPMKATPCKVGFEEGVETVMLYDGFDSVLPEAVRDWAVIINPLVKLPQRLALRTPGDTLLTDLADCNDIGNMSFNDIADIIEMHWKELV